MEMGKVGGDRHYRTAMLAAVSLFPFFSNFAFSSDFRRLFLLFLFAKIIFHRSRPPTPSAYPHLLEEQRGNPKILQN